MSLGCNVKDFGKLLAKFVSRGQTGSARADLNCRNLDISVALIKADSAKDSRLGRYSCRVTS